MRTHYFLGWLLINLLLRFFWRFRKKGAELIPKKGGVIIASNHAAYVDPPFLGAASTRELYYFAKSELFNNRLFGWLIRKYNAFPITRGSFDRKGISQATGILRRKKALLLFPEGTRSKDGNLMEPKLGAGKIALEAGVPIVPAYIANSKNLLSTFLKRKKLVILFGAPIFKGWLDKIPRNKEGYKRIGQEIMSRIKILKEKVENDDF
ncbi:MAG: lysophospholipid acyltransferase family protein [Candidatus Zixiibacteriota bacterium]